MQDELTVCEHGIRHPWACHECDERHTSDEVVAMMEGKPFAGGTTLELVRHWMMSGDYPPNDWERQFAAAIDAHRQAALTAVRAQVEGEIAEWLRTAEALAGPGPWKSLDVPIRLDVIRNVIDALAAGEHRKDG